MTFGMCKNVVFKGRNGYFYFVIQNLFFETLAFQKHSPICSERTLLPLIPLLCQNMDDVLPFVFARLKFPYPFQEFRMLHQPKFFSGKKNSYIFQPYEETGCESDVSGRPPPLCLRRACAHKNVPGQACPSATDEPTGQVQEESCHG